MRPCFYQILLSSVLPFLVLNLFAQETAIKPKLILPIGHTEFINQLAYNNDGTKIATSSADHTAKIWNVSSGKLLVDFNVFGSQSRVKSVAFNHTGSLIAISFENEILLADAISGQIKDTIQILDQTLNRERKLIYKLSFSQDDSTLYAFCNLEFYSWNVFSKKIINKREPSFFDSKLSEIADYFAVATRGSIEVYDSIGNNIVSVENLDNPRFVQFNAKDSLVSFLDRSDHLNFYHVPYSDSPTDSVYQKQILPKELSDSVSGYSFSPDKKTMVLISTKGQSKNAIIIDAKNLKLLQIIEFPSNKLFNNFAISPDSKYYAFSRNMSETGQQEIDSLIIWNRDTKNVSHLICPEGLRFQDFYFSPDSKQVVSTYEKTKPLLWDIDQGIVLSKFEMFGKGIPLFKSFYSNDGNRIIQVKDDGIVEIWDAISVKKISEITHSKVFNNNNGSQAFPVFNHDASLMAEIIQDSVTKVWGVGLWNTITTKRGSNFSFLADTLNPQIPITSLQIHSDSVGTKLLTTNSNGKINLWRLDTKALVKAYNDSVPMGFAKFSPNGKFILGTGKSGITAWKLSDGSPQYHINLPADNIYSINISANRNATKFAAMRLGDSICQIYDIYTGKLLNIIKTTSRIYSATISDDQSKLVTYSLPNENISSTKLFTEVWDLNKNAPVDSISLEAYQSQGLFSYFYKTSIDFDNSHFTGYAIVKNPVFSPDAKALLTVSANDPSVMMLWNLVNHDSIKLKGHTRAILSASFSRDGKYIITSSLDNTSIIWKNNGTPLFTFIGLPGNEYLVMDSDMRFDGSNEAKKNLYVSCGNEIIDLEQFEDLSWEPDLVEKTLGIIKSPIKAQSISSIKLCSMIPLVLNEKETKDNYNFTIFEHQGGIGKIELYVNNKRIKIYSKSDLIKFKDYQFQLKVDKKFVQSYFLKKVKNLVYLRVYTSDNKMLSRGESEDDEVDHSRLHINDKNIKPDVYLVSIGINKYKGAQLNKLVAPPYDAKEFSKALIASSGNLFNRKDSIDHVFSYVFTSDSINPSKENIMKALDAIALKAKADDIFIFFFAGHAIYNNSPDDSDRNQLYLLTSESSSFDLKMKIERDVAISSDELLTALQNMKMSNQMLVLDACNTGTLNKDVRVLEKLNDKQGTFILAGSAPTESAFERSDLMHGILTYSLLQDIKEGANLHSDENGNNNIIGAYEWLDESRKLVIKKTMEFNGQKQVPQVFGKNSFDVGMVDSKVRDAISLPLLKKLIGQISINYNDEKQFKGAQGIKDSLPFYLKSYIGKNNLSSEIVFNASIGSENKTAYVVVVSDYKLENNKISIQIKISNGNEFIKPKTLTDLAKNKVQLMNSIAKYVIDSIINSKTH